MVSFSLHNPILFKRPGPSVRVPEWRRGRIVHPQHIGVAFMRFLEPCIKVAECLLTTVAAQVRGCYSSMLNDYPFCT